MRLLSRRTGRFLVVMWILVGMVIPIIVTDPAAASAPAQSAPATRSTT